METEKIEPVVKMVEWFDDHWYKIDLMQEENSVSEYLPSVTTKLGVVSKPFLAIWRGDIGNREADLRSFESSQSGSRIHNAFNVLCTNGAVVYQPHQRPNYSTEELSALNEAHFGNMVILRYQDEMWDILKLKKWLEVVKPAIVESEKIVYDLKNRDAGTADLILRIDEGEYQINGAKSLKLPGGFYVCDLKTGKVVDDDAYMQTSAYSACYSKMTSLEIVGTLILHTGSKNKSGIEGLSTHYRNQEQMAQDYQDYRHAAALWERKHAKDKPDVFEFPSLLTLKENV